MKKTILSGIQPSGALTLGSYVGALRNFVSLSDEYECFYMLADLHAITARQDPIELRETTLRQIAQYVAAGIDPKANAIFVQSHVHEHAELGWVLDCYTMFGELSRMTQFKDKSAKNTDNINAGLFTYPALMAADILLYRAHLVPVGDDQKQHLEITRDVAERFNGIYGETFVMPEAYIPKIGARIMSLQDPASKMSKSDKAPGGCVYLLDDPKVIEKNIKRAVTDSDGAVRYDPETKPGVANLMQIYSATAGGTYAEIEAMFAGKGYGDFKKAVAEAVIETFRPIREETERLLADKAYLTEIYREGADRASSRASETLRDVYNKVGFLEK